VAGVSVLVITHSRWSGDALAEVLERRPDVTATSVAISPDQARGQAKELRPAVALVDLPPVEGLPLAREMVRICAPRIVALGCRDAREVLAWAEVGAAGCATYDDSLAFVTDAIGRVAEGKEAWSDSATPILKQYALELARIRRIAAARPYGLTPRESEVLELVSQGLSNKEIARILRLEVHTVKNHVQHLFRKVGVHHRGDLVGVLATDERLDGNLNGMRARQPVR
jgi:two-component system, NarL family, nitrate/nitrite response regulator NarL